MIRPKTPKKKADATSRRSVLRAAGLGLTLLGTLRSAEGQENSLPKDQKSMIGTPFEAREVVRLGVIGVGARGASMLPNFLAVEGVQIVAVCDIDREQTAKAQSIVEHAGQKSPTVYDDGETAFEALVRREDVDCVYIAAPWHWHVPIAVAAMQNGKHVWVEVPAATTIEDCWKLVKTSELTRRHCIMCENCCYGNTGLMVLNMVRAGLFGDLLYGQGAYIHDLRKLLFEDKSEGLWRRFPHTKRNGNLYPTHGLGPVAQYMGIHRGDRFTRRVSMSSREASMSAYRAAHVPPDSPKHAEVYVCGDMNTSLIQTELGRTIVLQHDVVTPRPYSRANLIAGTKGTF